MSKILTQSRHDFSRYEVSMLVHFLADQLGQVIRELEPPEHFQLEEQVRLASIERREKGLDSAALQARIGALDLTRLRMLASSFAVYFDLINIAEDSARVGVLKEWEHHPVPGRTESVRECVRRMKEAGVPDARIRALLENLQIELVLTAHPTQSKRRTVLSKLQRISKCLRSLQREEMLSGEIEERIGEIRAEIVSLWYTDRSRAERPEVADEVRTGLYFVDGVFWEVFADIHAELEEAVAHYYPGVEVPSNWLTLASWIGGDRDGNPFVTHQVTAETLRLHRGLAVEHHKRSLRDFSRRMSLSSRYLEPSPAVLRFLAARKPLPAKIANLERRYVNEPYRLALALLANELEEASLEPMVKHLLGEGRQSRRADFQTLLETFDAIVADLPERLRSSGARRLSRQLRVFGLHAARLDIREDSSRLTSVLDEVLRCSGIVAGFAALGADERLNHLIRALEGGQAPDLAALARDGSLSDQARETLAVFLLMARTRTIYGPELLGPFVISMTRSASDLLTVVLLAQWSGCSEGLQVVPLFETLPDLDASEKILSQLLSVPVYRKHLGSCRNLQMVMIGYSDSNKDAGLVSSGWGLYRAQERLAKLCREQGVDLTFFHGRGGTAARGGGPADRSIKAQPPGTVVGKLRVTEQGEILEYRYSDQDLAKRHLEQMVSAVLDVSVPDRGELEVPEVWRTTMTQMASAAHASYRSLVYEEKGFTEFWRAATPIEELGHFRMGSRPASRKGGPIQPGTVRAIPWVFSWMQSRYNLPSWYGLSALSAGSAGAGAPDLKLLREMYEGWPFFNAMVRNAELSLLKADMDIAKAYSELVPDIQLSGTIFTRIKSEFERSRSAILDITGRTELLGDSKAVGTAIRRRNPYVDPLNYIQIEILRRLRALSVQERESEANASLWEVLFLTVNGIASGLRNTG